MDIAISILIPTKGRLDDLKRLLETLSQMSDRATIAHEVIVANNAPDESTARTVERLVAEYAGREGDRWRHLREPVPGKSRALNQAIPLARGKILGFLDDDVEVTASWLRATYDFFEQQRFEVKQGAIQIPPDMRTNGEFLNLLQRFRTICYYGKPEDGVKEIRSLNAANIAVRREFLANVGLFDERIGPGRSGTSMDVEFGERVLRKGGHIGYEPKSVVYHHVDWSRLTEDYFRLRHEMQGKSRLIYKRSSVPAILFNLVRSMATFCWYAVTRNERKKYRAKGRYFHYRAMLQTKIRPQRNEAPVAGESR
jgi:cellulose synthase/poly-beta-1,6-N-acetylglucosamine synthase-like glycosyltransferase